MTITDAMQHASPQAVAVALFDAGKGERNG